MEYDYDVPEFIEKIYELDECFPRSSSIRIWVHPGGNVSPWHYDVNMVNLFNTQVTGTKEWYLLSPQTPPKCYPFCYYAIIDGRGDQILRDKIYTKFTLNEGDMVYVPPCWFHKVVSHGKENISLNWAMTNKKTSVTSTSMAREIEIYKIQIYFTKHRFEFVRKAFDKIYFMIPDFLRYRWHYEELIDTPYSPSKFDLWKRIFKEITAFGQTLLYSNKAYATIRGINSVKRLDMN
jgi:hypothetical protein